MEMVPLAVWGRVRPVSVFTILRRPPAPFLSTPPLFLLSLSLFLLLLSSALLFLLTPPLFFLSPSLYLFLIFDLLECLVLSGEAPKHRGWQSRIHSHGGPVETLSVALTGVGYRAPSPKTIRIRSYVDVLQIKGSTVSEWAITTLWGSHRRDLGMQV